MARPDPPAEPTASIGAAVGRDAALELLEDARRQEHEMDGLHEAAAQFKHHAARVLLDQKRLVERLSRLVSLTRAGARAPAPASLSNSPFLEDDELQVSPHRRPAPQGSLGAAMKRADRRFPEPPQAEVDAFASRRTRVS